jgi:hypothetical protein
MDWIHRAILNPRGFSEFGLDVAADLLGKNAKADAWLRGPCCKDGEQRCFCGLCSDWRGSIKPGPIFLNPPFGRGIEMWAQKVERLREDGPDSTHPLVVAVWPASTATNHFQLMFNLASEVYFLHGRVWFLDDEKVPQKNNTTDTVIFVVEGRRRSKHVEVVPSLFWRKQ